MFFLRRTTNTCRYIYMKAVIALGGLVVSVLATGPKVRGFDTGRDRWIFKIGGEVKPSVPCRRM
jgi:hypothetical protein